MSERFSTYLDLVRFLAALVVLLSHFAYTRFTGGDYLWIRELNLGSDAVVVFFVLSGFIISRTARVGKKGAGTYFFDRATRLFSVAVPALALTFVLDRIGAIAFFQNYDGWWYNSLPAWEFFVKGLTFSSEWTGMETRLGTNGPYWSLSYEAAYYALFGVCLFTGGYLRIILLALMAFIFGLNVMLLLPCWLLGVAIDRLPQAEPGKQGSAMWMAILPAVAYAFFLALGIPHVLNNLTIAALGPDFYASLRFSNEFIWNFLIAAIFAFHLLICKNLMAGQTWQGNSARVVRWLAGASFSIYLVHYPALQFLSAILPSSGVRLIDHLILLVATLTICFMFAEVFERRLGEFRRLASRFPGASALRKQAATG